jgi:ribosomal-protein-alanine N-acetyltransferase
VAIAERPQLHLVTIRPARVSDALDLRRWRGEPSVRRFQPLGEVSLADLRADLAAQDPSGLARGRGDRFQWIVEVDRQSAGWVTLAVSSWPHGLAEIGYALSTPFQRRGLMPQALEQILAQLFLGSTLERIEARCHVGNRASQQVLERLGFTREGLLRSYFVLDGERVDNALYALLRNEFLARLGPHARRP